MMNKFSHSLIALPLLAAALLTACGGGSTSTQPPQQAGSIAVGEPAPGAKLDTAEFVTMARSASCNDLRNRLIVIDEKQVLWDRAGNCSDNGYAQKLFGSSSKTVLCSVSDSIAGPRTECSDEKLRDQFTTIVKNLDKADLGLGAGHTVRAVEFLPASGTVLATESIGSAVFSGVTSARNVVVKDKAAWASLWAETHKYQSSAPALPEIDFDSKMVIGVYQGEHPNACHYARITKVAVDGDKLVVNYSEHDNLIAMMCIQAISSPYHLVTVARTNAAVEFANITANKLYFQDVHRSNVSGIDTAQNLVIKDATSWASVWERHAGKGNKAPEIDFTRNMVIGSFLGQQANGCYDTDIVNIDRSGDKLNVTVRNTVPGPRVVCIMMMTAPAHLVVLERVEGKVEFSTDQVEM